MPRTWGQLQPRESLSALGTAISWTAVRCPGVWMQGKATSAPQPGDTVRRGVRTQPRGLWPWERKVASRDPAAATSRLQAEAAVGHLQSCQRVFWDLPAAVACSLLSCGHPIKVTWWRCGACSSASLLQASQSALPRHCNAIQSQAREGSLDLLQCCPRLRVYLRVYRWPRSHLGSCGCSGHLLFSV